MTNTQPMDEKSTLEKLDRAHRTYAFNEKNGSIRTTSMQDICTILGSITDETLFDKALAQLRDPFPPK